jgi:glutamine amidotransferase|tara:strand:+ start:2091 stop:2711 length:621 start_codon:yes stop_codon:yes gene_type:complete
MKLKIVDLGISNIHSIYKCISFIGFDSEIVTSPDKLIDADKIIFPGVGAFNNVMNIIKKNRWNLIFKKKIFEEKVSILGICLGMQLLCKDSTEHQYTEGLNFFDNKVEKLNGCIDKNKFKIPHVGWNDIEIKKNSTLLNGIKDGSNFYFDHSFAVIDTKKNVDCITNHQINFASVMSYKNIFGVQFHPEKSLDVGKILLKNFIVNQ